jgi:hypothetical protein
MIGNIRFILFCKPFYLFELLEVDTIDLLRNFQLQTRIPRESYKPEYPEKVINQNTQRKLLTINNSRNNNIE